MQYVIVDGSPYSLEGNEIIPIYVNKGTVTKDVVNAKKIKTIPTNTLVLSEIVAKFGDMELPKKEVKPKRASKKGE